MSFRTELLKGSSTLFLLHLLSHREMYGYELAQKMSQLSREEIRFKEGTLYPALQRLERKGWVTTDWRETAGGRQRKYYTLTESGRAAHEIHLKEWRHFSGLVDRILSVLAQEILSSGEKNG